MLEYLLGIGTAVAEESTDASSTGYGSLIGLLIPMVLMFVLLYFIMIRPQRKKDKAVKEMLNNLKAGDRICTIGGIYGTITSIKDDTVTLAVGRDNLNMVFARWAIRSVEEVTIENDAKELN